jgi:hypothetical protein
MTAAMMPRDMRTTGRRRTGPERGRAVFGLVEGFDCAEVRAEDAWRASRVWERRRFAVAPCRVVLLDAMVESSCEKASDIKFARLCAPPR